MGVIEIFLIGVGLSMDAFAVSVCKGLTMDKMSWRKALLAGIYFGGFQFLMPVIGYLLGYHLEELITSVSHWIAFILLCLVGANMIKESRETDAEEVNDSFDVKTMLVLAVATSIDALAIGVSFAFLNVNIWSSSILIGLTTFCFSVAGIKLGHIVGDKMKSKAELLGGLILIGIGIKILLE